LKYYTAKSKRGYGKSSTGLSDLFNDAPKDNHKYTVRYRFGDIELPGWYINQNFKDVQVKFPWNIYDDDELSSLRIAIPRFKKPKHILTRNGLNFRIPFWWNRKKMTQDIFIGEL